MSDFNVKTHSLGSAAQTIETDAANMQSEFSWLNRPSTFEDRRVASAVSGLLLTWRISADRAVGDLYTLAGNLKAAEAAYAGAEKAIEEAAIEASPPPQEDVLA